MLFFFILVSILIVYLIISTKTNTSCNLRDGNLRDVSD